MEKPIIRFDVTGDPDQEFIVEVKGDMVLNIKTDFFDHPEQYMDELPDFPEMTDEQEDSFSYPVGDVVKLFVDAFNKGFFTPMDSPEAKKKFEAVILSDTLQKEKKEKKWHVRATGISLNAMRVLYNLVLSSLEPEQAVIKTIRPVQAKLAKLGKNDVETIPFPQMSKTHSFRLDIPDPIEGEPFISIRFERKMTEAFFKEACEKIELWLHIVMLGGYSDAEDRMTIHPHEPEWGDESTIEISFEKFMVYDESLHALVNFLNHSNKSGWAISAVEILND